MEGPGCATCPWWARLPEKVEYRWSDAAGEQEELRAPNERGECRRYPPRPPREFPLTTLDDWCAEHPERRAGGDGG
ncbi:MAG TPA: hypothetical protein VMH50_14100 [Thermoleophilia bacterium]|nr:hypothetical protein [Thermoleophilia bacterium]